MDMIKFCNCSIFITYLLYLDGVVSEVYRVGDDSGWSSGTGTNYLSWSQNYNFTTGDVLVFKYSKAQHNVKEVTDATYRSCDASSGVVAIYESGNDEIRLGEVRKYNFICDKDNHCIGGMRFSIKVSRGSNSNDTTSIEAPSLAPLPPPPPASQGKNSASSIGPKVVHIFGMVLLIFMF